MKKQKYIIWCVLTLVFFVLVLLLALFLDLKKERGSLEMNNLSNNKGNQEVKSISKEQEQALKTLNLAICQEIENEEERNSCIENVKINIDNLKEVNPVFLGSLFFQAGNYDEAINIYESAIENENKQVDIRTYLDLALTYAEKGTMKHQEEASFPKALNWIEKAISLEPDNPEVYRIQGYVYETKPDYNSALSSYYKSLEIDSGYIPSYIGRCHVHSLMGLASNALEDCQKAVELDKEKIYPAAYLHLCRLEMLIEGKQDEAIKNCQVVVESLNANENEKATASQMIANIKIEQGDFNNEIPVLLQKAILYAPQDPNNYVMLAVFYNEKKDFGKAKENAQRSIELDSKKSVAFGELGYSQMNIGDTDEALKNFKNAISLIDEDYSLLVGSKDYYKDRYCGNLEKIYQERGQIFNEKKCQ